LKMRTIRFLLLAILILAIPGPSFAQFGVSITIAPPALPIYSQPMAPGEGYLWTPGYWAYGDEGYFWVPGTWVMAPEAGLLWTPGYWGWNNNSYAWNDGYWGPQVGFYGGVDYGYGYGGVGYQGGYWRNGAFNYNRSVNNIDRTNFHHVYNKTVVDRGRNRVSYNGGTGGIRTRPTAAQRAVGRERHTPATAAQSGHQRTAGQNHELLAAVNHGRPAIAATSKPGEFNGKSAAATNRAVNTRSNGSKAAENRAGASRSTANKASENRAAASRSTANKAAENRAAASRSSGSKAAENRAAASRSNESKAAENRAARTPAPARATPSAPRQQPASRPEARPQSAPRPPAATRSQPATRPQPAQRPQARPATAPRSEQKAPGGKEQPHPHQ
jgi:WXXGXW repeat (2 copies)